MESLACAIVKILMALGVLFGKSPTLQKILCDKTDNHTLCV